MESRDKQKRKAAKLQTRKQATKDTIKPVLIVCEWSKTEPNFFQEMVKYYKLSPHVEIDCDCGTDPVSVVNKGIARYKSDHSFNKVFLVFDRDQYHLDTQGKKYQAAIKTINDQTPKNRYEAITSVPCFEYWLLLFHKKTTKPYKDIPGGASSGDCVLKDLKKIWPDYEKGSERIFNKVLEIHNDHMQTAITNAEKIDAFAKSAGEENPSTKVHKLISYLLAMPPARDFIEKDNKIPLQFGN